MKKNLSPLYFSPINVFGNYIYRHILLNNGADFVFSELILIGKLDKDSQMRKLKIFESDISKTIFQIGVESIDEIKKGTHLLKEKFSNIKEINMNMGCPQSSMQNSLLCSGVMFNPLKMSEFSKSLAEECAKINVTASVKIRLGTSVKDDKLNNYIKIINSSGIKKIYIHARFLRYNYSKPALYEKLENLASDFPNIDFIFNGDVDSYVRASKLISIGSNGVLIGRAALNNPLIFNQIKDKKQAKSTHYNPIENDSSINIVDGKFLLSDEKKQIIQEFIQLAKKHNELDMCKRNLLYILKGVSNRADLTIKIQETKSFDVIENLFE